MKSLVEPLNENGEPMTYEEWKVWVFETLTHEEFDAYIQNDPETEWLLKLEQFIGKIAVHDLRQELLELWWEFLDLRKDRSPAGVNSEASVDALVDG